MRRNANIRTVLTSIILLALLCLLAAVAGCNSSNQMGRFQYVGESSDCYIFDTATGQLWHRLDRDFKLPKIQTVPVGPKDKVKHFLGEWRYDEENITLWLQEDGTARAAFGNRGRLFDGRWSLPGSRTILMILDDEDIFTGEITPDGGLILWDIGDDEDDRMHFHKAE